MKEGFYAIQQAGGDQDPHDEEAYSLGALAHFKDGRFVGVDAGGCKISGDYKEDGEERIGMRVSYDFRAGVQFMDGTVLEKQTRKEFGMSLAPGAPTRIDVGFGPMFIRLIWLAETA